VGRLRPAGQCDGRHTGRYLWQGSRQVEESRTYEREAGDRRARHEIRRWHYRPGSHAVLAQERLRYDNSPKPSESEWYPLACDPNGAPHTMYSSEGRAVWRAKSGLWGETARDTTSVRLREMLRHTVHDPHLAAGDDQPECELRFAGQWADEESGLHYNCQRYYDPQTGQYLSVDPIGLEGGLRTHAYVHDPMQWCDPTGLQGYENQLPERLPHELATAKRLGVEPMKVDDPRFGDIANEGTIKYVVTKDGKLLVVPKFVNGEEISHAVIVKGAPTLAAGEADVAGFDGAYYGSEIAPHSGHYHYGNTPEQNAASEGIARGAFGDYGIFFPEY
jgi:RHS repeat-associated protein